MVWADSNDRSRYYSYLDNAILSKLSETRMTRIGVVVRDFLNLRLLHSIVTGDVPVMICRPYRSRIFIFSVANWEQIEGV